MNFKRDSTSREAKENKQGQENMEVESSFPSDEKKSISENAKEPVTGEAKLTFVSLGIRFVMHAEMLLLLKIFYLS